MSLPLVTRFGADPLLDLEVANKQYVDNSSGGGGGKFYFHAFNTAYASTSVFFWTVLSGNIFSGTESIVDVTFNFEFTIVRHGAVLTANTRSNTMIFNIRDDAVDANTLLIGGGLTGEFISGVLAITVASGSLMAFEIDPDPPNAGSHVHMQYCECEPT